MEIFRTSTIFILAILTAFAWAHSLHAREVSIQRRGVVGNNWFCRSRHNPVIVLHGLFASRDLDLNFFETWLRPQGYCTFGLTYGTYPILSTAGGVRPVDESAVEIANFIRQVLDNTGASRVDIVGHSEGGFQALYVPKTQGLSNRIEKIVALAPPTMGTPYNNLISLSDALRLPVALVLKLLGCAACGDIATNGGGIHRLNQGPIVQPGNDVTIIATKYDAVVTPPGKASFISEPGVFNTFVQDACPSDRTSHNGMALDENVYNLILNGLTGRSGRPFYCLPYIPILGRR